MSRTATLGDPTEIAGSGLTIYDAGAFAMDLKSKELEFLVRL